MSTLKDLNKHLFDQLDRLSKSDKTDLDAEIKRAQALEGISEQIIKAYNTQLDAVKLVASYKGLSSNQETPKLEVSSVEV